jgi:hypothetical protein
MQGLTFRLLCKIPLRSIGLIGIQPCLRLGFSLIDDTDRTIQLRGLMPALCLVLLTQPICIGNLLLQAGDRLGTFLKQRQNLPFGMVELAIDLRTRESLDPHTGKISVVLGLRLLQIQDLIPCLRDLPLDIGNPGMCLVQCLIDRTERLTS